jgi:hypothetical protein
MQASLHNVDPRDERFRMRPARRWPLGSIAIVVLVLASAVVLAGRMTSGPVQNAAAAPPPLAWIDIERPIELFGLNAPDLPRSTLVYEARRHRKGGGRQDILTFGKLNGDQAPFVRLMLYRVGSEQAPQAPLFVELARLAAGAGLSITRSLAPEDLATRFGDFETADIDLAAGAGAGTPCLGFRGAGLDRSFRISGVACGIPMKPLSRPALACLLDRLDLNSAASDGALADFFAATELRRDPICAGTGLAPMVSQTNWIDQADAPPPLRLRKAH